MGSGYMGVLLEFNGFAMIFQPVANAGRNFSISA
jgi:hypothetical protein